ncbi:MAG: hypothetical protein OXF25_11165 [Cyanobacteria bacterium MAG CAR3_bin_5]|nr:hypothetical protein [Cyanobacteria bacterium MAG CAR3_bin_5]MCY4330953.1 hypothetical protein [Cyanobacteria bacterium MAG CAR1_bin_15]
MTSPDPRLIDLHGLASSPRSAKARFLAGRAQAAGLTLQCPDLNTGGFRRLTVTRMLEQTRAFKTRPAFPGPTPWSARCPPASSMAGRIT